MGLARIALAALAASMALAGTSRPFRGPVVAVASAAVTPTKTLTLFADRDDDDANGVPDGEQPFLPAAARVDIVPLEPRFIGTSMHATAGADLARLIVDGRAHPWDRPIIGTTVALQGLAPGAVSLVATLGGRQSAIDATVRGVSLRDGEGNGVDMARSHASLERTPPARLEGGADATHDDPDALRVVFEVSGSEPPHDISLESVSAHGVRVDVLANVALAPSACSAGARAEVRCFASAPIRLVIDDLDRNHPLVDTRSVRAEIAGAIIVREAGRKTQQYRVLGPRKSPVGAMTALRATLRPFITRVTPSGAPAIGTTDAGAIAALRTELAAASAIWGQCGITLGDTRTIDIRIVDPPPSHLIALGDGLGLGASGGEIRLRVDGRPVTVAIAKGASPDRVAYDVARAVERAGFVPVVSPNARIGPGASGSVDVSVRRRDGTLAAAEGPAGGAPLSTDATLTVRIGAVDLSDGLHHFTDSDAMAGTLEERTLLKAVDDGDPRTVEVVVVPLFAGGGRIGESFIASDLSSLRNVVLLDRAGIRARKSSLTLAHELGHVLLDMPGHPDDYGVDTPTLLMDSDASDASPFGPRRITIDECVRVMRQAGPSARVPLLVPVPLAPIPADTRPLIGN